MQPCIWVDHDERDENGKRRVRCINCGFVTKTRSAWPPEQIHRQCPSKTGGLPGTQLRLLIEDCKLKGDADCGCTQLEARMNQWGPDGCREHRAEIVAQLTRNYRKVTWTEKLYAGRGLLREKWFRIADPVGSFVDEAIRRAEAADAAGKAKPVALAT
jgi:hypothetical protein